MTADADDAVLLTRGARALGVNLDKVRVELLTRFLDELYRWNATGGLTTVRREDAVRLHLIDSLTLVPYLPASGVIADLGTGAGLPGIPAAVVSPRCKFVLVESRRRKCSFLSEVVRLLGLDNCMVLECDARKLKACENSFDAVVSRAFLRPRELLSVGRNLVRTGGRIIVMGARRESELDEIGREDPRIVRVADRSFQLFGGDEQRRIVVMEKRS